MNNQKDRYPPISDYALISDCHGTALVSRDGSVDWCCLPRVDDDSYFGRLLDWDKGGYCRIAPADPDYTSMRNYVTDTMILETHFQTRQGEFRLVDFFAMDADSLELPRYDHVRILDGVSGEVDCKLDIWPRFDYGEIDPYIRQGPDSVYIATGSNKGLLIHSEMPLDIIKHRGLTGSFRLRAGQRMRIVIQFQYPELIDRTVARGLPSAHDIDLFFEQTRQWWQDWASRIRDSHDDVDPQTMRSTIILKSLTFDRTGAIIAAPTTSLPEWIGGERNWDYRFSWVRDSVFTIRALHELGCISEADRFHQFIERSAAGSGDQLQIMYGVDGKRRLTEIELESLEGYRRSRPVRIGNRAAKQTQLDIYGELLEMAWEWHESGHCTDPRYWAFLASVADTVCECWQEPDHGIWEVRGEPAHYVHSKVMCWAALNRAIALAQANGFDAPLGHWLQTRDAIRHAIETKGYDPKRGIFVQTFDQDYLDSVLLLLPRVDFVAYDDPRMVRTVDAIRTQLERNGLLRRYNSPDGLPGPEGSFLPCTFWLVACLAYQGRRDEAWTTYRRALACANDVGLFSEEFDVDQQQMLGNFPQGLVHVSQITARLALGDSGCVSRHHPDGQGAEQ